MHQQCNGKVEKFNGFLMACLATITKADQSNWDELIDHALMVYRTTVSRSIEASPFYVIFGRDPVLPYDLKFAARHSIINSTEIHEDYIEDYKIQLLVRLKQIYEKLFKTKEKIRTQYKNYYDKSHREVKFKIKDLVMVYVQAPKKGMSLKLLPKWEGPFEVIAQLDTVTNKLAKVDGTKIMAVHVQRMRPYKSWTPKI